MSSAPGRSQNILLPAAALRALHTALVDSMGAEAAAGALQRAGHTAGDAIAGSLDGVRDADEAVFWSRLGDLFARRGWGRFAHETIHAGIGALDSGDWAEAAPSGGSGPTGCHFTTGLLANLLGRIAGDEVGVLEVECRSRGDLRCRFLFGARDALEPVYAALAAGRDAEQAIADLQ